ncbi:MAG: GTPase Era [Bacilli bacterium]
MSSGFVSLIGRPNAGKSTLLNQIVKTKVAITSNKPQTTRNVIQGIYNEDDTQIVFVDTPGIHKPTHKLGTYLNRQAYYSLDSVDIVVMVVDASEKLGTGDIYVLDKIKESRKPVILVLNKIDKLSKEQIFNKIVEYKDLYEFNEIVPVSAFKDKNVNTLISVLKKYLKDDFKYFEDTQISNKPLTFLVSEIVREKVFELTEQEVPHSLTCVLESFEKNKDNYVIRIAIIVDRESLKKIVIGKQGSKIKEVGIRSRKEIEQLLGKKVFLETFVKTIPNWRDREKYLAEFGFQDFE